MKEQINAMLELQDQINTRVHPQWRQQGFAWYRAIWTECAELMEHYGWKWWKKQQPDADQVALELVDIWHFGLSIMLVEGRSADAVAAGLESGLAAVPDQDFREVLESFTLEVLRSRGFDLHHFAGLMSLTGLSFDDLYRRYVGKNMLNRFRQEQGYQQGSYIKVWNGLEDNQVLMEVLQGLDTGLEDFAAHIYQGLEARYPG